MEPAAVVFPNRPTLLLVMAFNAHQTFLFGVGTKRSEDHLALSCEGWAEPLHWYKGGNRSCFEIFFLKRKCEPKANHH